MSTVARLLVGSYIVVPVNDHQLEQIEDLRVLEGDFEFAAEGIQALWSDAVNSIVGFAFEPGRYTEEQARAWVKEHLAAQATHESIVRSAMTILAQAFERIAGGGTGSGWFGSPKGTHVPGSGNRSPMTVSSGLGDAGRRAWNTKYASVYPGRKRSVDLVESDRVVSMGKSPLKGKAGWPAEAGTKGTVTEVFEDGYERGYTIEWDGGIGQTEKRVLIRPHGKIIDAFQLDRESRWLESEYFQHLPKDDASTVEVDLHGIVKASSARDVIAAIEAAAGDAPVWVADVGDGSALVSLGGEWRTVPYTVADDGQVTLGNAPEAELPGGGPRLIHAFAVTLGASDIQDNGLVWKELIHPGTWFKTDSGKPVQVTRDVIEAAFRAWQAGLPKHIAVPADIHWPGGNVPADKNRGFVRKLQMVGDRLYGGFDFTDPLVAEAVQNGSIADCSVYIEPGVTHPETGQRHDWVLQHVLLTNDPLVRDLKGWGAPVEASAGSAVIVCSYEQRQEEESMTEQMTADQQALLEQVEALGLSAQDLQALAAQREQLASQAQALAARARELEITAIVQAMQGRAEHAGVVQVEGHVHYPVVCQAVEKALREGPEPLALSASAEGTTSLDGVLLAVVNALPAEARMALAPQPQVPKEHKSLSARGQITDEQIDEFAKRV